MLTWNLYKGGWHLDGASYADCSGPIVELADNTHSSVGGRIRIGLDAVRVYDADASYSSVHPDIALPPLGGALFTLSDFTGNSGTATSGDASAFWFIE